MEEHIAQIDGWEISTVAHTIRPDKTHATVVIEHGNQPRIQWDLATARQWAADLYWAATNADTSIALANAIAAAIRRAEQLATTRTQPTTEDT